MIKRTPYLTLVFLLFSIGLSAQMHHCGVTTPMGLVIQDQMIQNRNEMRDYVQVRNAIVYLPVRFFLVAKSDGSDRKPESTAMKALCHLNNNYADQDIQFYLKEFKYLNSTNLYTNGMSNSAFSTLSNQTIYNAINIYLVDDAGGGAAAFYQPPAGPNGNDWIVSSDSYADDFETLTHEVGHFFSLSHPFFGWDSEAWNLQDHGNPVGNFSPGGILNEFADSSNCENAGDMICDTPADYRFDFPGSDGCTYTPIVKDPKGELIHPDLTNFMNYASCNDNLYHFTDDQKAEVQNSLNSASRNYIPKNYTPTNLNAISSSPTIVSPQNLQTIPTYNYVELEWSEVENADHYLLEVVHSTDGKNIYIVDDNKVVLTDLQPQSNYFWKVMGYNEYSTCGAFSGQKIFKTGTDIILDTNEIPGLSNWTLGPNPLTSGELLLMSLESEKGVTVDVMVSTVTGQTIQLFKEQKFANGISTFEIDTNNFATGIYIVSLHTADGVLTKRVSIL